MNPFEPVRNSRKKHQVISDCQSGLSAISIMPSVTEDFRLESSKSMTGDSEFKSRRSGLSSAHQAAFKSLSICRRFHWSYIVNLQLHLKQKERERKKTERKEEKERGKKRGKKTINCKEPSFKNPSKGSVIYIHVIATYNTKFLTLLSFSNRSQGLLLQSGWRKAGPPQGTGELHIHHVDTSATWGAQRSSN